MKGQKLPREVVQVLWKIGLGGKRIYVPKQPSQTLVATHTPILLEEIERFYEEQGLTFYEEGSRRKVFSGLFGKNRVSMKYGLKSRTAASVASAAWRGWRDWFGHKERSRLILLQSIAESNEKEYGALYFSYLQIRNRLRKKQKVTEDYYAKYHSISVETVEEMIRFAKESISSCPWRNTADGGGEGYSNNEGHTHEKGRRERIDNENDRA